MGYISIFLGLAVVVALMIRRWSPLMVGIVAATVVIFMNGLPFGETMTGTYFDGFCTMFKSLFPPIFSGSLLAQIYNRSGAVNAVGDAIANALFKDSASATRKYVSCILAMAIASGILAFCGLNALVTLIAMYPIALRLMERAGIPKRFVMGILSCGVYTFAMSAPGSAELVNILAMQSLNTPSYAGICGGILACITEIAVTTTLTTIMIKKDVAKGKTFAYGPKDIVASNNQPRPKALVALLPLLALVLLFNIFSIDIFSSHGCSPSFCSGNTSPKRMENAPMKCWMYLHLLAQWHSALAVLSALSSASPASCRHCRNFRPCSMVYLTSTCPPL